MVFGHIPIGVVMNSLWVFEVECIIQKFLGKNYMCGWCGWMMDKWMMDGWSWKSLDEVGWMDEVIMDGWS